MSQKKHVYENNDNLPLSKKQKKIEVLQEIVCIRPDLKGKTIYFFPTLNKFFEGILMYDAKEEKPMCILVLKLASILYTSDYIPYWRTKSLINSADILSSIQERILLGGEFAGTSVQEISGGLEFQFFKKGQLEKKITNINKKWFA
ncbi:unnamed protein product [Rhizophagus irregularis]|nr:unnamed protein product [Rhizophagus irregularis]